MLIFLKVLFSAARNRLAKTIWYCDLILLLANVGICRNRILCEVMEIWKYRHSILLKLKILTYSTLIFNLIGYIFQNGYFEISLRFFLLN